MSHSYAGFAMHGSPAVQIRTDTRVYADAASGRIAAIGSCRGVVWMCNPGSAKSVYRGAGVVPWGPITTDPTLTAVLHLYREALEMARREPGRDDYFAILNCFYSCGASVGSAYGNWRTSGSSYREEIPNTAGFILPAWGSDKPNGVVSQSIREITESNKPVFFHDPTERPSTPVSNKLLAVWYPAHPLSQAFRTNMHALAAEIAPFL